MYTKQSDFQNDIDTIQKRFIHDQGWARSWFTDTWPHITLPEHENLNIPDSAQKAVRKWEKQHKSTFPWHYWRSIRSSRNLHSSQVLGLTLLGALLDPVIHSMETALSGTGLLQKGESISGYDFEYEPRNVFHESRRTSVDLMLSVGHTTKKQIPIYFEVKFLEAHFGSCSRKREGKCDGLPGQYLDSIPGKCQLMNEGIRYWKDFPRFINRNPEKTGCPIQGPMYQLARNFLHIIREEGRALVILSDKRAQYIDKEISEFENLLAPRYRNYIRSIKFQELIQYLEPISPNLAQLMGRKYGVKT